MKKIFVMLAIAIVVFIQFSNPAAANDKIYKFGIWFGVGTEFDAQNKQIITDVIKVFSQKSKYKIVFTWFNDYNKFVESAKKGELDFVYAFRYEIMHELLMGNRYEPFLIPSLLDAQGTSMCLYVSLNGGIKTTADLKGKRIMVAEGMPEYYVLRMIMPGKPENIFGTIEKSKSGMSSIYSLAMGDTDAVYASDVSEKFMKMNNPGPTKKITRLTCSVAYPLSPIMAAKDVPDDLLAELKALFSNMNNEDSLKKYKPLFTTYKFKFSPVNREYYKPVVEVFQEAKKKKWDKDYEVWKKIVKKRE